MKITGKKKIIAAAVIILILAAGIWILTAQLKKNASYEEAVALMREGRAEEAYVIFRELDGYNDAEEKIAALVRADPVLPYRMVSKGDRVIFGTYEQDNDLSNGAEPVEWMVLDRIDDEILLFSVNCLDCRTYNDISFEPVTWETSAIRAWLNGEFYSQAFSEEEKQMIMAVDNQNPDQSVLGTEGGRDTTDRVYLLGEKEAGIYMGNEWDQDYIGKAPATEYAAAQGIYMDENGLADWWLRSPGAYEYTAQFTETSGIVYTAGAYVDIQYGVRPAIWLNTGN